MRRKWVIDINVIYVGGEVDSNCIFMLYVCMLHALLEGIKFCCSSYQIMCTERLSLIMYMHMHINVLTLV